MAWTEEQVLIPLPPERRDVDTDNWPEFTLKHCKILSQKSGDQVSLLTANPGHLVRVEGQLEQVDRELQGLGENQIWKRMSGLH